MAKLVKFLRYLSHALLIYNNGGLKEVSSRIKQKFFTKPQGPKPPPQATLHSIQDDWQKRVLIIDQCTPTPDQDSGSLRMYNLLQIFQGLGYQVSFIPSNLQFNSDYTPAMQKIGIDCFYRPYLSSIKSHLQEYGNAYSVVLLSRADTAEKHIEHVKQFCPGAKVLFDTVDLHFLREQRLAALKQNWFMSKIANIRKKQELKIARRADTTLVVSSTERDMLKQEAPDIRVELLSNIHSTSASTNPFQNREDILFIGSFEHPPNVDAMHFFIDEVFPIIKRSLTNLRLQVVGGNPPRSLREKARADIVIDGFISDIKPLFNKIRLSIAPLRYGAGVKGKINSSMSFGVPVVATTLAVEGMHLEHDKNVLIANSPEDFAEQVVRAYQDESLWQTLSEQSLENVKECFSFEVAEKQLGIILK